MYINTLRERLRTHSENRAGVQQTRQKHYFPVAQKGFLQYSFVSVIATTTVFSSKIICAPRCWEPHVNRRGEKKWSAAASLHTHSLLCFLPALNQRAAGNSIFPSKWWLSATSSIRALLCELYGAKKVNAITSHRRSGREHPENR